jgi:hypothetical protein
VPGSERPAELSRPAEVGRSRLRFRGLPAGAIGAQPTCFPPGKANSPACDAPGQKGSPTRTDDGPRPFDK